MILSPGQLIDNKYRIETLLRETPTRRIYRATHLPMSRSCAVHCIRDFDPKSAIATQGFLREAGLHAAMEGVHIVAVRDLHTLADGGAPVMITEPLDGWWLSDRLQQGPPLPTTEAVMWLEQALAALDELHQNGVVHRDFNPQHMVVVRSADDKASAPAILKVLGLGVARRIADDALVASKEIIGTPAYIAPEQVRNAADADPRADLWSWGASLYEALSGRPPFGGDTLGELFVMILEFAPVSLAGRGVPASLEAIVMRCLEKNRDNRFASVAEVRAALDHARSAWTS